jgi:hypothetical protein
MDSVQAAEQRIRAIVNAPRRRHALLRDRQQWLRLCSAMDVIGDTQLAVRAYLDEPTDKNKSTGWSYLVVYGILQVLYVQQDASMTIANCLKLVLEWPIELEAIRETRNESIGHPTGRGTFISRISLSAEGFELLVPVRKGKREFRAVSLRAVVEQQTDVMGKHLERAVEELVADELAHRKQFRDQPLRNVVPHTLGYALEKIGAGLRDAAEQPMAFGGIAVIRNAVTEFRRLIDRRGLADAFKDSVGGTLDEIDHAVDRVDSHFKGADLGWNERDADVYWFFLAGKISELQHLASEIDQDYESDDVL